MDHLTREQAEALGWQFGGTEAGDVATADKLVAGKVVASFTHAAPAGELDPDTLASITHYENDHTAAPATRPKRRA